MNNKELAAQLILEAVELMDESAGRNGQMQRYLEARVKNGKEDDTRLDDTKFNKKFEESSYKKTSDPFEKITHRTWARKYGRGEDFYQNEFDGEVEPKNKKLHDKINNRAKKSQNECIATLLIEAAELLSDKEVLTESMNYKKGYGNISDEQLKKIKSVVNKNWKSILNKELKNLETNWNMDHKIVKKYINNPDFVRVDDFKDYFYATVWTNNNCNEEFFGGHSLNTSIKIDKNNYSIIKTSVAIEG